LDLDMLLQGHRKKLILLDDNLLAHPKAAEFRGDGPARLGVNFNQTLDLRRLTPEHADLLRRLHCSNLAFHRRVYHFSLNDCRNLESLRRRYDLLRVTSAENVEFVCMYGYNTSCRGFRTPAVPALASSGIRVHAAVSAHPRRADARPVASLRRTFG
jgi:hypothetical protein